MLSVKVLTPSTLTEDIIAMLNVDATVCDLAVVRGAAHNGAGDLILFDLARENANNVISALRHLGIPADGSIVVSSPIAVLSDAAARAERSAPGHPGDGVLWAQLADTAQEDSRPSWTFFAFLILATTIAGIGRVLDQPILIVGAMVVGPEFAPIAAIAYALACRKRGIAAVAWATLLAGFALSVLLSLLVWTTAHFLGIITYAQATAGPQTDFIVRPNAWSFVIALLAGVAGMLSLTTSKSSVLVGVFISITTVPAVAAIGLTAAVGAWSETLGAVIQLSVNVAGLILAGTATLIVQLHAGRRISVRLAARRARRAEASQGR